MLKYKYAPSLICDGTYRDNGACGVEKGGADAHGRDLMFSIVVALEVVSLPPTRSTSIHIHKYIFYHGV